MTDDGRIDALVARGGLLAEPADIAEAYLGARDRALASVVSARTIEDGQAAWTLAKAHNRCAREKMERGAAGDYGSSPPLANAAGGTTLNDLW